MVGVSFDSEHCSSNVSFLSKSIPGALIIPSISPLSDRSKLKLTDSLDNMACGLASTGFQVGWGNGSIQISPKLPSLRDQHNSEAINAFLNPQLETSRKGLALRLRTQSSLVFSRAPSLSLSDASPRGLTPHSDVSDLTPLRKQTSVLSPLKSVRLQQMSVSTDSLHHQTGASPAGLARSKLAGLSQQNLSMHTRLLTQRSSRSEANLRKPGLVNINSVAEAGEDSGSQASFSEARREVASRCSTMTGLSGIRPKRAHPMAAFRPQRSHAFIVFSDLDKAKNGKITLSQLEGVALSLGLSEEQARKLFVKIDASGKGYINVSDWGKPEICKAIERFSLMYMQKFLGLPDVSASEDQVKRYWQKQAMRQAKNLPAAINLIRINTVTRQGGSGSGNVVYDAFRFMDTDNSGQLSLDEVKDGFYALGVNLADGVADQLFNAFDKDCSGTVEYDEFLTALFPSARDH